MQPLSVNRPLMPLGVAALGPFRGLEMKLQWKVLNIFRSFSGCRILQAPPGLISIRFDDLGCSKLEVVLEGNT